MRRLNRYLGKTVFLASIGSLLVFIGLNYIANMVGIMEDINDNFPLSRALLVMFLRIPNMFTEFLPYGIFVGCVIGLGLHANNNELSVMRAAGVSVYRLLWAVMRPTLVLIVVGLLTSEFISPVSLQLARGLQDGRSAIQPDTDSSYNWYRDVANNEFLHFNRVETGGRIFGLSRYQFNENGELQHAGFADQAIYQQNGRWQLENYRQSNFFPDRIERSEVPNLSWHTELEPRLLNILVLPPDSLSITDVYQFAQFRDQQNLQSHEYKLDFWQRVLQPLMVLALVLVGMSFIFGSLREATMGSRIGLAVIVGFFMWINISMLGTLSTLIGFSPLIAVLLPTGVCGLAGMFLLSRR